MHPIAKNNETSGESSLIRSKDRFELAAKVFAWLIVVGLGVELWQILQNNKFWPDAVQKLSGTFLILVGVAGEILLGSKSGKAVEALRHLSALRVAEANERASAADLKRVELEKQLTARTLNRKQFDVLKQLKGKVPAIIIASDADAEPVWFATVIASALQNIGLEVNIATRAPHAHSIGNFVCDKRAFINADGEPTNGEPIVSVFNEAGIPIGGIVATRPQDLSSESPDIPVVVIGGRYAIPPASPYLGEGMPAPHPTMVERMRNP